MCLALLQGTLAGGEARDALPGPHHLDAASQGGGNSVGDSDGGVEGDYDEAEEGDESGGEGGGQLGGMDTAGGGNLMVTAAAVEHATLDAALVEACKRGHADVAELLLGAGAKPSPFLQGSALEAAMAANSASTVRLLIKASYSVIAGPSG